MVSLSQHGMVDNGLICSLTHWHVCLLDRRVHQLDYALLNLVLNNGIILFKDVRILPEASNPYSPEVLQTQVVIFR